MSILLRHPEQVWNNAIAVMNHFKLEKQLKIYISYGNSHRIS